MDLREHDLLDEAAAAKHWYYRSKARAIQRALRRYEPASVLDVGAGSGYFSRRLLSVSSVREALCVDINYSSEWDESVNGKPLRFRRSCASSGADLVLLVDVLEHVDDDVGLLREYGAKVAGGTRILVSVPALKFLWSGHDAFLGHKRRYSLREIESVVTRAGMRRLSSFYYFGLVLPAAAVTRLARRLFLPNAAPSSQLGTHGRLVNAVLHGLCSFERSFMMANRLAGLSAFVLCERPSGS
jgi:SAM-dependent methyltransferase